MAIGVPEECVDPLKVLGFDTIDKLKAVLSILKDNSPIGLNELKEQAGLRN